MDARGTPSRVRVRHRPNQPADIRLDRWTSTPAVCPQPPRSEPTPMPRDQGLRLTSMSGARQPRHTRASNVQGSLSVGAHRTRRTNVRDSTWLVAKCEVLELELGARSQTVRSVIRRATSTDMAPERVAVPAAKIKRSIRTTSQQGQQQKHRAAAAGAPRVPNLRQRFASTTGLSFLSCILFLPGRSPRRPLPSPVPSG